MNFLFSLEPMPLRSSSHCGIKTVFTKITNDLHAVKSKAQISVLSSFPPISINWLTWLVSTSWITLCTWSPRYLSPWFSSYLNGLSIFAFFVESGFIFPTSRNWSIRVSFSIYIHSEFSDKYHLYAIASQIRISSPAPTQTPDMDTYPTGYLTSLLDIYWHLKKPKTKLLIFCPMLLFLHLFYFIKVVTPFFHLLRPKLWNHSWPLSSWPTFNPLEHPISWT